MQATSKAKAGAVSERSGGDGQSTASALETAIRRKTAKVGVIGLGYVGLPLIRTFVAAGFRTLGFDVDADKVEQLAGRPKLHRAHPFGVDRPLRQRGHVHAHGRHGPAGRGRRPADLRAHAVEPRAAIRT